mgnify:CR=1 FL=1
MLLEDVEQHSDDAAAAAPVELLACRFPRGTRSFLSVQEEETDMTNEKRRFRPRLFGAANWRKDIVHLSRKTESPCRMEW